MWDIGSLRSLELVLGNGCVHRSCLFTSICLSPSREVFVVVKLGALGACFNGPQPAAGQSVLWSCVLQGSQTLELQPLILRLRFLHVCSCRA